MSKLNGMALAKCSCAKWGQAVSGGDTRLLPVITPTPIPIIGCSVAANTFYRVYWRIVQLWGFADRFKSEMFVLYNLLATVPVPC